MMLDNILYLTDFSQLAEAALSFAIGVARTHDARIYALHLLKPTSTHKTPESPALAIKDEEKSVGAAMQRVNLNLAGLRHEIILEKAVEVWASVEQALRHFQINLVVLGTRGRAQDQGSLLGSVAKDILHRSPVPVLTIGCGALQSDCDGPWFRRALVAMDFTPESTLGASYAASLAEQNQAQLVLLHVRRHPGRQKPEGRVELSAAEAYHLLHESVPQRKRLRFSPNVALAHGEPVEQIIETAEKQGADLIVLGIRDSSECLGEAKEPERKTAREVVAYAPCPVLTVRGKQDRITASTAPV
jgi:nucleotide-binding universal stress UspA family protein